MTAIIRNAAPTVPIPMPTLAPVLSPPLVAFSFGAGAVDVGMDEVEMSELVLSPVAEAAVVDSTVESNVLVVVAGLTDQLQYQRWGSALRYRDCVFSISQTRS